MTRIRLLTSLPIEFGLSEFDKNISIDEAITVGYKNSNFQIRDVTLGNGIISKEFNDGGNMNGILVTTITTNSKFDYSLV